MDLPPFSFLAMNTEGLRGKFEPVSERIGDFYTLSLIERTEEEVDKKIQRPVDHPLETPIKFLPPFQPTQEP